MATAKKSAAKSASAKSASESASSGASFAESHEAPASAAEIQKVREGEAKPSTLNDKPAPRGGAAPLAVPRVRVEVAPPTSEPVLAKVVPLFAPTRTKGAGGRVTASQPPKGYREVEVIATRAGHYGQARKRAGDVFVMGLASDGALPSWVTPANEEDSDPVVARSRGIPQSDTEEQRRADIEGDAGTEQPMALGGTGRQPDRMRS